MKILFARQMSNYKIPLIEGYHQEHSTVDNNRRSFVNNAFLYSNCDKWCHLLSLLLEKIPLPHRQMLTLWPKVLLLSINTIYCLILSSFCFSDYLYNLRQTTSNEMYPNSWNDWCRRCFDLKFTHEQIGNLFYLTHALKSFFLNLVSPVKFFK